jgi:hypothetical protein
VPLTCLFGQRPVVRLPQSQRSSQASKPGKVANDLAGPLVARALRLSRPVNPNRPHVSYVWKVRAARVGKHAHANRRWNAGRANSTRSLRAAYKWESDAERQVRASPKLGIAPAPPRAASGHRANVSEVLSLARPSVRPARRPVGSHGGPQRVAPLAGLVRQAETEIVGFIGALSAPRLLPPLLEG